MFSTGHFSSTVFIVAGVRAHKETRDLVLHHHQCCVERYYALWVLYKGSFNVVPSILSPKTFSVVGIEKYS